MDASVLLDKLDKVRSHGKDRWMACCPAHDDRTPSLLVTQANERVLIHCFAGCGATEILNSVGLTYSALYPDQDEYTYRPEYKKPNLEDDLFIRIYKESVRLGRKPLDTDTQRYNQLLQKRFGRIS